MTNLMLQLEAGFCCGPLFAPPSKIKALVRPRGKEGSVHRAQTKRATPSWLTIEQKKEIGSFYSEAKYLTRSCGELYVVDHIVPKMSRLVCGLHVPWNLRVIHWLENAQKGAHTWPDMPMEQIELELT